MKLVSSSIEELPFERLKEKCKNLFKQKFYMVSSRGKYYCSKGKYFDYNYIDLFDIKKIIEQDNSFGIKFFLLDKGTPNERLILKKGNHSLVYSIIRNNDFLKNIFAFKNIIKNSGLTIALSELNFKHLEIEFYSSKTDYIADGSNKRINYFDIVSLVYDEELKCGTFKLINGKEYVIKLVSNEYASTDDYRKCKTIA